jgi:hypothetical protein
LALVARARAGAAVEKEESEQDQLLYAFEVVRPVCEGQGEGMARTVVRVPVILPAGVEELRVEEAGGVRVAASLLNAGSLLAPESLRAGLRAGELVFITELEPEASRRHEVRAAPATQAAGQQRTRLQAHRLENRWLALELSAETGVASLTFEGQAVGGRDFLAPFITYGTGRRPRRRTPRWFSLETLGSEQGCNLTRARLEAGIVMGLPYVPAISWLKYTFTLFDDLPYLFLDVEVDYPQTRCEDEIRTVQQQLRRLVDLGWVEVAPCQLQPEITVGPERPLRVWKHNYLGVTSHYDLDYGRINPRNRELDSFSHQVTAGWVAISNGSLGMLVAENSEALASMAFCPMRLRERDGKQRVGLNPFGSYYGRQLDYRHLGGNGLGAEFTAAVSGSLRPNAPSFNGQRLAFSLMLAPFEGDEPPAQIQADALAHFYPPAVVYIRTPECVEALLPEDLRDMIAADEEEFIRDVWRGHPLRPPRALVANPTAGAADLVWDPPLYGQITGYEVRWREVRGGGEGGEVWHSMPVPPAGRWQVGELQDGVRYAFQVRAVAPERASEWTEEVEAVPGAVGATSIGSMVPGGSVWALVRIVALSLVSVARARLGI